MLPGVIWLQRDQRQNIVSEKVEKEINKMGEKTSVGDLRVKADCLKEWEKILLSGSIWNFVVIGYRCFVILKVRQQNHYVHIIYMSPIREIHH